MDTDQPNFHKVKIFDLLTKEVTEIPQAELAPGMIEAYFESFGEKMWVNANQILPAPIRHPEFHNKRREQIRKIMKIFNEVRPLSFKEWEDGFRRETNPDSEISLWQDLGEIFQTICKSAKLSLLQKKELLAILLQCSGSPYECIRNVIEHEVLPQEIVTDAIETFYGQPKLKKMAAMKPACEYPDPNGNTPNDVELLRTVEGREVLKDMQIILGIDLHSGNTSIFFGREKLQNIIDSGLGENLATVSFLYDARTDQLELLVAAVTIMKGSCCYPGLE